MGSSYAFPWTAEPPFGIRELSEWRKGQSIWRLTRHVDPIPKTPFEEPYDAASTYLEVRHDGYRPEFVPLKHARPRSLAVRLQPVLHKRIAVLDFPCDDSKRGVSSLSQLIAQEIAARTAPGGGEILQTLSAESWQSQNKQET